MNADVDLIGTVIADYSLGRHRGLTDEETQERAEKALSWLTEEVESLQARLDRETKSANNWILAANVYRKEKEQIEAQLAESQRREMAAGK